MSRNFWCETCGKKYKFSGNVEFKERIIQEKLPYIDPSNNKKQQPEFVKLCSRVKCNKCGFVMTEIKNDEPSNS
jgi:hypothetical protein